MDKINLPNSYPFVLGHCYLFLIKNRVFGLLDRIGLKLPQKIRKNSRTMTPVEETSYETPPLKIQNFIVQTHYSFFFNYSYSQKNPIKFALVLFDF